MSRPAFDNPYAERPALIELPWMDGKTRTVPGPGCQVTEHLLISGTVKVSALFWSGNTAMPHEIKSWYADTEWGLRRARRKAVKCAQRQERHYFKMKAIAHL